MYTNIDTNHALATILKWLDSVRLPERFPLAAVKAAMEVVMCNKIFEWGDCYFLQLFGAATAGLGVLRGHTHKTNLP